MSEAAPIAETAALIGDRARAAMLMALMDGQAHSAMDLAVRAGITPGTASSHLGKLVDGNLLSVVRQGRYRYFRIASDQVARLVEQLMIVAADGPPRHRRNPEPTSRCVKRGPATIIWPEGSASAFRTLYVGWATCGWTPRRPGSLRLGALSCLGWAYAWTTARRTLVGAASVGRAWT